VGGEVMIPFQNQVDAKNWLKANAVGDCSILVQEIKLTWVKGNAFHPTYFQFADKVA